MLDNGGALTFCYLVDVTFDRFDHFFEISI